MLSFFSRTRRNHGLEHATLNLLGESYPKQTFAGHSDAGGFWILGEISTSELTNTVIDALDRLKSGQSYLAIHKNCGTNLLISGFAAGMAGAFGLIGVGKKPRDKFERIPIITALGVVALVFSQPLGPLFQKTLTTNSDPGPLELVSITRHPLSGTTAHRIKTRN